MDTFYKEKLKFESTSKAIDDIYYKGINSDKVSDLLIAVSFLQINKAKVMCLQNFIEKEKIDEIFDRIKIYTDSLRKMINQFSK